MLVIAVLIEVQCFVWFYLSSKKIKQRHDLNLRTFISQHNCGLIIPG